MSERGRSTARLVLDTSAYSHLRLGHSEVLDRLARATIVLLPTTALGELHAGFELGRRTAANREALERFLEEPFVRVVETTPRVARRYGALFAELRRAGTPVPTNDLWIAAATIEAGAELLTFDSDFERIAGLERTIFYT